MLIPAQRPEPELHYVRKAVWWEVREVSLKPPFLPIHVSSVEPLWQFLESLFGLIFNLCFVLSVLCLYIKPKRQIARIRSCVNQPSATMNATLKAIPFQRPIRWSTGRTLTFLSWLVEQPLKLASPLFLMDELSLALRASPQGQTQFASASVILSLWSSLPCQTTPVTWFCTNKKPTFSLQHSLEVSTKIGDVHKTSIIGMHNSVQVEKVRAAVNQCNILDASKPCPWHVKEYDV